MTAFSTNNDKRRLAAALLVGTILGGSASAAFAQQAPATAQPAVTVAPPPVVAPAGNVKSIRVEGTQRLEPETVLSYLQLSAGDPYTFERLDQAVKELYATELFADVQISGADSGNLVVQVRENPVINRIVLDGNKRLKDDKITPEIRLAPRQIFTRSKVRADVARIIELYQRQGRYAATVEPKIVELDQNRVDLVFEISEGDKSKVRAINIIGNEKFSDGRLHSEMATKETGMFSFLGSGNTYDPDKLAFDQQKLRQFYLTEGYADFRVVSAVAELTPDKRDFIITYVVEEGERYKFGDVKVESEIRDLSSEGMTRLLPMKAGDWYNAKLVEDTVTSLGESTGLFGYAFAQAEPEIGRNKEARTMDVTFKVADAPRVYVERIDVNGNTVTRDKVIRREFRLAEGDPFNTLSIKRSQDRIKSLGYFQENLEIKQEQGSAPDRAILSVGVEEKSTGELQLQAGYSSLERFLVNLGITQRNFMGKGQTLSAQVNYSAYSKSASLGFTEPYLFDRNIAVGGDIYRRDYRSFSLVDDQRNTTYEQTTTGAQLRAGVPLTENMQLALRYTLSNDKVTLDRGVYYFDPDGEGPLAAECDPLIAGRYLCDAIGTRTTSALGYTLVYSTLDNSLRPTRGMRFLFSQDFAGLGGSTRYLKSKLSGAAYKRLTDSGFILSITGEAGFISSFEKSRGPNTEKVRLTDRFFLGDPDMRGFDIRGIGPRVQRYGYQADGSLDPEALISDDALGGTAFYRMRGEVEIPLGNKGRELGLRPSIYIDVGSLFRLTDPAVNTLAPGDPRLIRPILAANGNRQCLTPPPAGSTTPGTVTEIPNLPTSVCPAGSNLVANTLPAFKEFYFGDSVQPRLSVGFGVNWNSPFGPFRIDVAKAIVKQQGDDTKLFTFGVGTQF